METTDGGHGGDSAIDVASVAQGLLQLLTDAMRRMSSDELTGLFPYFEDFYQSTTPGLLVIMDEQALDRFYSGMLTELTDCLRFTVQVTDCAETFGTASASDSASQPFSNSTARRRATSAFSTTTAGYSPHQCVRVRSHRN